MAEDYSAILQALQARRAAPDRQTIYDPSGMAELYRLQDERATDMQHNLDMEDKVMPSSPDQPGAIGNRKSAGVPFTASTTHGDLKALLGDMQATGIPAQRLQTEQTDAANQRAIQAGFGGSSDIMHIEPGNGAPGTSNTYTSPPTPGMPMQRQAEAGRAAELAKLFLPEQMKNAGALATEVEKGNQARKTLQTGAEVTRTLNAPPGSTPPATPTPAATPPTAPLSPRDWVQADVARRMGPDPNATPPTAAPSSKVYLNEQGEPMGGMPPQASAGSPEMGGSYRPAKEFKFGMSAAGAPMISQNPERNITAQEQVTADTLRSSARLAAEIRDLLRQQNGGQSPADEPLQGFLGQLGQVAKSGSQHAMYAAGFPDPTLSGDKTKAELYNRISQLVDMSSVIATKGMMGGMRNYKWIQEIQNTVGRGGQPTATQMQRLDQMLAEYPQMVKDIYASRAGQAMPEPPPSPPQ